MIYLIGISPSCTSAPRRPARGQRTDREPSRRRRRVRSCCDIRPSVHLGPLVEIGFDLRDLRVRGLSAAHDERVNATIEIIAGAHASADVNRISTKIATTECGVNAILKCPAICAALYWESGIDIGITRYDGRGVPQPIGRSAIVALANTPPACRESCCIGGNCLRE